MHDSICPCLDDSPLMWMMDEFSQCNVIFRYVQKHGSITAKECSDKLGITRLSARIADFKKRGYEVTDIWEYGMTRYGKRARYKRYFIKKEDKPTE